jgi:hypothetical protein
MTMDLYGHLVVLCFGIDRLLPRIGLGLCGRA